MPRVAVVGAGPLGASTALALATRGLAPTLVDDGPASEATYRRSGGSVCWHRPHPDRAALIRETADWITAAVRGGAPIRVRETPYLFLAEGVLAPALNVASADLVAHLVAEARAAGAGTATVGRVRAVEAGPGGTTVVGTDGTLTADVVVLALGRTNADLVPGLDTGWEKRQLFVLDLPVDTGRARMPHVVVPVGAGFAYAFVKEFDHGLRVVVGQEDLVDDDADGPVDHFADLIAAGVGDRLPFLRGAGVERVLWGVDRVGKLPDVRRHGPGLLSVNCGSAVRMCVPAGRLAADAVARTLAEPR